MIHTDYLVRATALDERVRAFALHATDVVGELQRRHDTYPGATAALGRTAMGALLLGAAGLKEPEHALSVEVRGGGPIGRVICTANGSGEVRGMVSNPHVHAPSIRQGKLNVAGVVGTGGYLSVTKSLGLRDTYQGTVELQSGEIGDDLAFYLARSEQTPSAVGIGVFVMPDGRVEAAGGFLVQLLPGLEDEEIQEIEARIAALPHPTKLIREGVTPEGILDQIFEGEYTLGSSHPIRFHCPCSRERFEAAIVSLGQEEVNRIIEEEQESQTEVVCHFCNEKYYFSHSDMQEILEAAR